MRKISLKTLEKIISMFLGIVILAFLVFCLVKFFVADEVFDKVHYGVILIAGTIYLCRE